MRTLFAALAALVLAGCATAGAPRYDVIIAGGTIYDGSGAAPFVGDVAIEDDRIAAVGDLSGASAATRVDATGMAVAPGFINMLSWATETLLVDGRSQSDIRQGVTLEVMGEGWSMGPIRSDLDNARRISRHVGAAWHFDERGELRGRDDGAGA